MTVNRHSYQGHPYHLVEPSPWPLLTSFALLTLTTSAVMYFHGYTHGLTLLVAGFFATLFAMILWFRDVSAEGAYLGNHTFAVQKGLTLGVALFIVSEVFFFPISILSFFPQCSSPYSRTRFSLTTSRYWCSISLRNPATQYNYSTI